MSIDNSLGSFKSSEKIEKNEPTTDDAFERTQQEIDLIKQRENVQITRQKTTIQDKASNLSASIIGPGLYKVST